MAGDNIRSLGQLQGDAQLGLQRPLQEAGDPDRANFGEHRLPVRVGLGGRGAGGVVVNDATVEGDNVLRIAVNKDTLALINVAPGIVAACGVDRAWCSVRWCRRLWEVLKHALHLSQGQRIALEAAHRCDQLGRATVGHHYSLDQHRNCWLGRWQRWHLLGNRRRQPRSDGLATLRAAQDWAGNQRIDQRGLEIKVKGWSHR